MTETITKDYTVTTSLISDTRTEYLEEIIVPVSIFGFAVLIIGTVFIRIWYKKTLKKRQDEILSPHNVAHVDSRIQRSITEGLDDRDTESFNIYNRLTLRVKYQNPYVGHTESLTTRGGSSYCSGLTFDESSHQSKNYSHINMFLPGTVCKRNNEELETHIVDTVETHDQNTDQKLYIYSTPSKHGRKQQRSNNSELKQKRAGKKTFKPKLPEPVHNTILHEQKRPACSSGIHDEELYANSCDIEYSNSCLRRDNLLAEDSNEYFNVRYDGKVTLSFNQINKSDRLECSPSETCLDMTEYINCGLAKGHNIQ